MHTEQASTQDVWDSVQEEDQLHQDGAQCKVLRSECSALKV